MRSGLVRRGYRAKGPPPPPPKSPSRQPLAVPSRSQAGTRVQFHGERIQCQFSQITALKNALQEERARLKEWTDKQWARR
eukprot:11201404-Lingulodinium_polyedra.AAC.1